MKSERRGIGLSAGRMSRRNGTRRYGQLTLLLVSLALGALATTLLLLPATSFAQIYGGLLYPALTVLFSSLTSWTVLPLGLALLPLACGIFLWRAFSPGHRLPLSNRLVRPLLLAVALSALYLIVWGANYRRPPLLQLLDVRAQPVSQEELVTLASDLLIWVEAGIDELEESTPAAADAALANVATELERLALELGWPAKLPPRVKLLPSGTLLRSGYAGMLFPFTLEAQVDAGLSPVSRVAVGAHELAHAAGFAAEADADLAALIAGLRSSHPLTRYATALSLFARTLSALPPQQRSALAARLPQLARDDLTEARSRSARYLQAGLAERISMIYSRLLKGQGVEAGVADYQRAPELAALLSGSGLLPPPPVPADGGVAGD